MQTDQQTGSGPNLGTFGYVYVITNPAMPGLVKIGSTGQNDVKTRMSALFTTGVPLPFQLEFACRAENYKQIEGALHTAFGPSRANPSREFFEIDPVQAVAILKLLHVEDVTSEIEAEPSCVPPQDEAAASAFSAKRPHMNFQEMGIPVGAALNFIDGHSVVFVAGPKKVVVEGEEMSLTAATRRLKNLPYSVQPSPFWYFEGKLLKAIYDETYTHTD